MLLSDNEYPKYWYRPTLHLLYRERYAGAGREFWHFDDKWAPSSIDPTKAFLPIRPCVMLHDPVPVGVATGHVAIRYLDDNQEETVLC